MQQAKRLAEFAVLVSMLVESAMPCVRLAPPASDRLCLKVQRVPHVLLDVMLLVRTM